MLGIRVGLEGFLEEVRFGFPTSRGEEASRQEPGALVPIPGWRQSDILSPREWGRRAEEGGSHHF